VHPSSFGQRSPQHLGQSLLKSFCASLVISFSGCATAGAATSLPQATTAPTPPASVTPPTGARGLILPPDGGRRFVYCARPVTLWLKVDSAAAPYAQLIAGIGELRGDEGTGRHRGHEVIYIRSGWGFATLGNDTARLGPGSTMYVAPGTRHRLVSSGSEPLSYFWVIGPGASSAGFERAASIGCPGGPAAPPPSAAVAADSANAIVVINPGEGERITYCDLPLVITAKIDSERVAGTWFRAATGALRRGQEAAVHQVDEVALFTHGRGRAFVGSDTVAVEAGSFVYTPRGMQHGFINESSETLEYVVVYAGSSARAALKRRAARPGPWCP
jgi:mannose-6-phosphate isomerase-like protein (cupin superfamily)